ncbi:hypothetical protein ACIB24_09050 [Spongisporangium articulatum]|uniref:DUF4129 domain-containing protein n=1 Tax=Spongisporangium articulatum TaxID=3362603 RepID=A0ABW8ALH6_9ACTN
MTRPGGRREPPRGVRGFVARALDLATGVLDAAPRVSIAVGFGLFLGVMVLGWAQFDYWGFRGVPRENAVVVASTPGPDEITCDKSEETEALDTYRVTEPRAGFPREFVISECPLSVTVGETYTIARKDPTARPEATVDPLNSEFEVLATGGIVAGIGCGASMVWQVLRDRLAAAYERRRPKPPRGEPGVYPSRASPTMRAFRYHARTPVPPGLSPGIEKADRTVRSVAGRWIADGRPELTVEQRNALHRAARVLDDAADDEGLTAAEAAYVQQARTLAASVLDPPQVVDDDWPF